jgi:hypothetical protein
MALVDRFNNSLNLKYKIRNNNDYNPNTGLVASPLPIFLLLLFNPFFLSNLENIFLDI